jgi:hypothetical protein
MNGTEMNALLVHLKGLLRGSAFAKNQILAVLLLIYRELLKQDLKLVQTVRNGNSGTVRLTLPLQSLVAGLHEHVLKVPHFLQSDVAEEWERVLLPSALSCKNPKADCT